MINQEIMQNAERNNKTIDPVIYSNEEWRLITCVKNIKPYYYISTYGRIYSSVIGKIMAPIIKRGYLEIGLQLLDNSKHTVLVHRIEMMTFRYFPGCEELTVNHINGCKIDNYIDNLEWLSLKENIHHAYNTGLRKVGDELSYAIYTNEQIHAICKAMEDGKSSHQIALEIFNRPLDAKIMSLLTCIATRDSWTSISDQYHIENCPRDQVFSYPQVEMICGLIQNGYTNKEILEELGITYNTREEYNRYVCAFSRIRRKKSFTEISSKYDI